MVNDRDGVILVVVTAATLLITRNTLAMIAAFVITFAVLTFTKDAQKSQEQQRRQFEEDWERLEERLRLKRDEDLRLQRERENPSLIRNWGIILLSDGTTRAATEEEKAAAEAEFWKTNQETERET